MTVFPYRRIRLDAIPDIEQIRQNRTRLRFSRKITKALIDEAVVSLSQAKSVYKDLEALYLPYVDLEGMITLSEEIGNDLLSVWNAKKRPHSE